MSGHVFIASHPREAEYRDRLTAQLVAARMAVWWQPAAEYGTGWLTVGRPKIDSWGAFVVLMTPRAASSGWVGLQVGRAIEVDPGGELVTRWCVAGDWRRPGCGAGVGRGHRGRAAQRP